MTFQEAVDITRKAAPPGGDWYEGHIKTLVALGILKLDDMKPDEEYELAIRSREIMDKLQP